MIELKHLKCLSGVKSNNGVGFLTPAAYPGKHCPMHTALALGARIKGLSTLLVGTPECGTYSRNIVFQEETSSHVLHYSYILDSNEVVFGFREGLMKALLQMEQEGAKAILLITTCVPEVIGEDIEGLIWELASSMPVKIIHVPMGHFKCNSYPSGYWKTLVELGKLAADEKKKSQKVNEKIINILGRSQEEEGPEPNVLTALKRFGFTLRMLAPKSELEDFKAAGNAGLNLVMSPFMNPLAEDMKKHYDIPYFSLHDIYKVEEIDEINEKIAEILNIPSKEFASEAAGGNRERAVSLQEQAEGRFQGIQYIISQMGAIDPLPLAAYLAEFSMRPILMHVEEFYPGDLEWKERILNKGYDPILCHMVNDPADISVLKYLCPDFHIGTLRGFDSVCGLSFIDDLYGQCGYERTALLLERMLNALGGR